MKICRDVCRFYTKRGLENAEVFVSRLMHSVPQRVFDKVELYRNKTSVKTFCRG